MMKMEKFVIHRLLFLSLAAFCFTINTLTSAATLPENEIQALEDIAKTLGKTNWNFNVNPCSGQSGWNDTNPADKDFANVVTCNCSHDTLCHVVSIRLKAQSLQGSLPPEMARLPFLQEIDLSRNYLNGTLPPEWGSLPLVNISILANRITGPIPKSFANISTLTSFVVESNQLSGVLPPELGDLFNIERLILSSNNFTGQIPATFAKLTNLKDFRISDNRFTGQIPDFIQNWTNLGAYLGANLGYGRLNIQASGLVGPIPSAIASLAKLTDLRISDLNGPEATFPPIVNMTNMKTLILRSCNISGPMPEYLGQMGNLKVLDLSYNKLSGVIPSSFNGSNVQYIYLTGNMLTGTIPSWILEKGRNIDLSYNNLTAGSSDSHCRSGTVNLFASSPKGTNSTGIVSCLRNFRCQKTYYSVRINCGGREVPVNGSTTFEDDTDPSGPSNFAGGSNWALSNTGHFLDDNRTMRTFNPTNTSRLLMTDSQLYMQGRISPISLTYYGFCLGNETTLSTFTLLR